MPQYEFQIRAGANDVSTNTWASAYGSLPHGDLVVAEGKGRFYESVRRGRVFSLYLNATSGTVVAGNIEAATAAATTQFALWNPTSNSYNLSILQFAVGIVSGTPTGGGVTHSYTNTVPTLTSATATNVPLCHNLSTATCSSVAGATLTGGGALKVLRSADFASTNTAQATVGLIKCVENTDGMIQIPPGSCWVPTWRGAGTSLLNSYCVTWEEVPIRT